MRYHSLTRRDFIRGMGTAGLMTATGCRSIFSKWRSKPVLQAEMNRQVAEKLFGGIVCASSRGDLACAGIRTLSPADGPVTPESLFDLASVGKTQTAALCALLYAQGKLDPDAPFTDYLPEHVLAKEGCKITVRDLATHSGGFDNAKPYKTPIVADYFANPPFHVRPSGKLFSLRKVA